MKFFRTQSGMQAGRELQRAPHFSAFLFVCAKQAAAFPSGWHDEYFLLQRSPTFCRLILEQLKESKHYLLAERKLCVQEREGGREGNILSPNILNALIFPKPILD